MTSLHSNLIQPKEFLTIDKIEELEKDVRKTYFNTPDEDYAHLAGKIYVLENSRKYGFETLYKSYKKYCYGITPEHFYLLVRGLWYYEKTESTFTPDYVGVSFTHWLYWEDFEAWKEREYEKAMERIYKTIPSKVKKKK